MDPEGHGTGRLAAGEECDSQALVEDGLERLARPPDFCLQLGDDVIVEGHRGPHALDVYQVCIMMPICRHL